MLPQLSSLTVGRVPAGRLRHRWSSGDLRILPLPPEYPRPLQLPSPAVSPAAHRSSGGFNRGLAGPATDALGPVCVGTPRGAGFTAAAGTSLALPFLSRAVYTRGQPPSAGGTRAHSVTLSRIAEVSRLLRPLGPGPLSQCPSPGSGSHRPHPSQARWAVTPPTT